jgi:uncharacterized protein with beta-barrel porin domain
MAPIRLLSPKTPLATHCGNGSFSQTGGNFTVTNNLSLGDQVGGSGTYTLSDGELKTFYTTIGSSGTGTFNQSGGTHEVDDNRTLSLGLNPGGSGTYNLSGGTFSSGDSIIGYAGSATFNQTGGGHGATNLVLGSVAGSCGTYALSNGEVDVGNNVTVGDSGSGTFSQSGGSHNVFVDLILGNNAGATGTYNLDGGSLTLLSKFSPSNAYIGNSGTGIFTQSGGTNTIAGGNLYLAYNAGSSGTYNLQGGSLSAGAIIVNPNGVFNQTGGSLDAPITLAGGTVAAGTDNGLGNQPLTINGGTIAASAANITVDNLLTIDGSFNMGGVAGTSLTLTSAMNIGDNTLTHNGASDDTLKGNLTSTASGGITVTAGTLNLTGNNGVYSGTSTVTGGTLNLQGSSNYTGSNSVSSGTLNLNSSSVITYSGVSTVTGGTLNMSSTESTYSGASTLSGGTLNLSAGTLSGLLTLNGGTFILSGTGVYANPAPLTNSAGTTLNVAQGSTLALIGGLTNNGNAGINGTLAGDLTNNAGGSVSGSGVITGTLTNNGKVNPGNSPGILNIVGSYVQTATGTYTAEIASATSYDRINVTGAPGTATLAGAIAPKLYGGFQPRGNQVFPGVLTVTGGITDSFSTILNQQLTPTLFWQTRYNPTSVDLWVQRNYTNAGLALNSNQSKVGAMLNSVSGATSGDLDNVLNAIDYLPNSAGVQNAYKQISPEKAGSLTNLGFVAATFQMRNLATRTTNLRFVQGEGGSSLTGGGLRFDYNKLDGMMLAFSGTSLSNLFSARKEFQAPESKWGLFMDGGAAFGSQNSTLNQTGYSYTLGGLTLGADYRLQDNLLVGLATGYSNSSAGFYGSGGSATTNTVPLNAYAAYFPGKLYAYGSLGYAFNLYDLNRNLNFNGINRNAASSTTGNQLNLYGETGYDLTLSRFILTPSATLTYSGLWVGGFTEAGAGALNLKVAPQSANSVQTGIGGRVTMPMKVGSIKVVPQGYAFFQHEFANGSRRLSSSLAQGSSTLSWQTDATGSNYALVGGSITAKLHKNIYAQVNYNTEVGRSNTTSQFINAGLRFEF